MRKTPKEFDETGNPGIEGQKRKKNNITLKKQTNNEKTQFIFYKMQ